MQNLKIEKQKEHLNGAQSQISEEILLQNAQIDELNEKGSKSVFFSCRFFTLKHLILRYQCSLLFFRSKSLEHYDSSCRIHHALTAERLTVRHRQKVCEAAGLDLTPENTGRVTLEEKAAHAEVLKDVVQVT